MALLAGILVTPLSPSVAQDTSRVTTSPILDEFERFDRKRWYVSEGWSNGDHQNCTWSGDALAKSQDRGVELKFLSADVTGGDPLCAEIQTRAWFRYGTFEVRMRTDLASGLNAAFFLYAGPVHNQPHDEIDFELLTKSPNLLWLNHWVDGDDRGEGETITFEGDPEGFHDYALIWEPDRVRWFVDGELVRDVTDPIPSRRMKVYFSHWGSGTLSEWMGKYEKPGTPVVMEITRFAYTPPGMDCSFPDSITCDLP
ncbi:family 16 glycosylhydrolase [Palleronia abyssalis]|nr:family 16 glycosylhydrolase [Palleronia abyssalis]